MRAKLSATSIALLLGAAIFYSPMVLAQSSQGDSVAEAARKAREQKKAAARPAPVITDDTFKSRPAESATLTPSADASSNEAQPPVKSDKAEPDSDKGKPDSDKGKPDETRKPSDAAKEAARKKTELAALKQEVADKQQEVDIAQREYGLESETYYSKPDFVHDKEGKARLDSMQVALNQQKDELATLKAKLAAAAAEDPDASKTEAPKP